MVATARRKSPASFLLKLREILAREDPALISWGPDGRITVGDPARLGAEVLARYFRHGNLSSFQRQLNYFGYYKLEGKGRLAACVYTNDALRPAGALCADALLTLKRKSSREGAAAAAAAAAAASRAPARPGTARSAAMRAAREEREAAAVSVSPDSRAAKRPRALSEATVVTVETYPSDGSELEDPLDAFFDLSEEAWDAPPPPGWLGGDASDLPATWVDHPVATMPELWVGPF
jgi:hypothetical protein